MAEEIQSGNLRLTDVPAPMNEAMNRLKTDQRVTMHLLPLPAGKSFSSSSQLDGEPVGRPQTGRPNAKKIKRAGEPSSKAKAMCPYELKDYKQTDEQGRAICWAFNLNWMQGNYNQWAL